MMDVFDYIVVGAGTAGCVLANRLSEDPRRSVLLIEAGLRPRSLWVDMPAGVSKLIFPGPHNWGFHTEPEPELSGRRIYAPRGRGLGGSSLINGMAFFRGHPQDYDDWRAAGNDGWGWSDVQPLFQRIERRDEALADAAAAAERGRSGEVRVTNPRYVHPSTMDFIESVKALGAPWNPDFNTHGPVGVGMIQFNIDGGVRHSADKAFLYPVLRQRSNLTVMTGAQVARVLLDDSRIATGLELQRRGGLSKVACRGEIILSAGAFGSPQILLNSGIGPADGLREAGVALRHELPGVGRDLQDHMYIHHTFDCDAPSSLNAEFRGARAIGHGLRYLLTRHGPLTTGASQACVFMPSSERVPRPDLQICFRPVSWVFTSDGTMEIGRTPQMTVSVCNLRPHSRGHVSIASSDPFAAPRIHANYLSTDWDRDVAVRSVKHVRSIFQQAPLAAHVSAEVAPGRQVESDEQILQYVRDSAQSMHHWAGTCRMGIDAGAVVDPQLRVRGVRGLRVADCSVLPSIVSANTNAVSFMVGEKAASLIH